VALEFLHTTQAITIVTTGLKDFGLSADTMNMQHSVFTKPRTARADLPLSPKRIVAEEWAVVYTDGIRTSVRENMKFKSVEEAADYIYLQIDGRPRKCCQKIMIDLGADNPRRAGWRWQIIPPTAKQ
jgi:hypothetical protein